MKTPALLKVSAVLWMVWGIVHAFAGVMTMASDPATAFGNLADALDPAVLAMDYRDAVGAVLNQHGWNLLWVGIVTIVGAVFIWRRNLTAIWVTAMVGGLFDVGYFLATQLSRPKARRTALAFNDGVSLRLDRLCRQLWAADCSRYSPEQSRP